MKIYVVDPQGREHALEALEGWRVMEVIRDWGLPMRAECGGSCSCATCHITVDPEWLDKLAEPELEELELIDTLPGARPNSRLSCQVLMRPELDGLRVHIAPEAIPEAAE